MKEIKKELPLAILILVIGFLFVICASARAKQIDNHYETNNVSSVAHK